MTRVSHAIGGIRVSFDDPNLVANAGLLLTATMVERLGLEALIDATVKLASWDAAMNQICQFLGGSDWRMPAAFYDGASDASTESLFAELIDDVR